MNTKDLLGKFLCMIFIVFAVITALSACDNQNTPQCQHQWVEADCLYPKTCRLCGETSGVALGHTEVIDEAVDSTCTKTGLTQGKHCSLCGKILVAQQETSALGHKWNTPNCTTPQTCSVCKATEGEPYGHTFENGECVDCNEKDPDFVSLTLTSTTYNINLTDYSDVAYITMIGGETVTYDIDDESVVSCEWGEWDGDVIPLTFTPVSSGNTVVTVYVKGYDKSIKINVSIKMTEGDIWRYNYYVDSQFGFDTDDWYLTTIDYIDGTFSNSATTNDELYVELLYDCNDEISIFLYEYANISYGLVKNNSSGEIDYYEIAIRNEDGYIYSARGQMHPGGDRIYIIDIYHDAVLNLMRTSDNLQFYIEDEIWTTTQYKFDVDMNNFNDVLLDVVDGEHLHTYTTTVIEPTCLKEGYTLYSCECEHYFCEDFIPTLDHIEENGICTECSTVTDAYIALANYVKCNGELDDNGGYYISYERVYSDTQTITYYIYTNSDASTLSFQYEEVTSTYVSTTILMVSYDEELHKVGIGISWSWGDDYAYGQIDYNYSQSPSKWHIYNYTCNLIYPSQAEDYKETLSAGVSLLLQGTQLYVMPDFITLEMLGFVNY